MGRSEMFDGYMYSTVGIRDVDLDAHRIQDSNLEHHGPHYSDAIDAIAGVAETPRSTAPSALTNSNFDLRPRSHLRDLQKPPTLIIVLTMVQLPDLKIISSSANMDSQLAICSRSTSYIISIDEHCRDQKDGKR